MHKYERFIIYPLLVLAFVYIAIGNPSIDAQPGGEGVYDRIVVNEISLVNEDDKEVINIGTFTLGPYDSDIFDLDLDSVNNYDNGDNENEKQEEILERPRIKLSDPDTDRETKINLGRFSATDGENSVNLSPNWSALEGNIGIDGSILVNDGTIQMANEHEDPRVYIGPSEDGHGLINVYDKYGEDWTSYGFRPEY